jgi:hypothetical protein
MSRADEEHMIESKAMAEAAKLGHDLGHFIDGRTRRRTSSDEPRAMRTAACLRCGFAVSYDRTVAHLRLRGVPVVRWCDGQKARPA